MDDDTTTAVLDGLERVQCHRCGRLLCKVQSRALRPSLGLEIRCRCHAMNFLIGTPTSEEAIQSAIERG